MRKDQRKRRPYLGIQVDQVIMHGPLPLPEHGVFQRLSVVGRAGEVVHWAVQADTHAGADLSCGGGGHGFWRQEVEGAELI